MQRRLLLEQLELRALLSADLFEYVIITSSALESSFQPLLAQKLARGLTGKIVTTEFVYANFTGTETGDNADKIRDFIADAYQVWGTQWVLLGGDTDVIPYRGVYASNDGVTTNNLPTDLYYACLDGSWNGDGDGVWGEATDGVGGADIDLVPEVCIGRAPASNAVEAANFVAKTIQYETSNHPNVTTAVWLGEKLDDVTWGSVSSVAIAKDVMSPNWTLTERYDTTTSSWTAAQLISDLNASPHFVNSLGHASPTYDSRLTNANVAALTNAFPYLMYSQGCDAGAFDTDVSIAEQHVLSEHGAFAAVMNSRKGWYASGTVAAYSHAIAMEFWDAIFNEGKVHLGEANNDSKLDNLSLVGPDGVYRWVYFETNLFGDPETPLQIGNTAQVSGMVWDDQDGNGARESGEPTLSGEVVFLDSNGNGSIDGAQTTTKSNNTPTNIVDKTTVTSSIQFSGLAGWITDVNVTLNIRHTFDGDLDVALITPSLTKVRLFAKVGGAGDNFTLTTLDDEALSSIASGAAPFSGTFRPRVPLSKLDGENPNGTWTLEITDTDLGDQGTLDSWSLEITSAERQTVTDVQGCYVLSGLAAGSYVVQHLPAIGWSGTNPIDGLRTIAVAVGQSVGSVDFGITDSQTGNGPPQAGDDAIALAEGATSTVLVGGATSLLANDTDPDLPNDTLTVTTTPVVNVTNGTLTLYADGTFRYVHNGSETLTDNFVYEVKDAAGHSDTGTVTITVSAVNDAPLLTVPGAKTVNEDTLFSITGISVADVDAATGAMKITMSVAQGQMTLAQTTGLTFTVGDGASDAAMTFTGTLSNVNAALARVDYLASANYSGADTLNISVDDQANTGSGGAKTDSKSIAITVAAVNDAPLLTVPGAQTVNEDTLFSITGISVTDVDAATGAVKITMSVAQGQMTLAQTTGLTFTVGDGASDAAMTFTGTLSNVNAALARVDYLASANYSGADTLNISVDDQGNTGSGGAKTDSKSIAITVAAVNDAPVLTVPGAQSVTEDTTKAITGISVVDVDAATGAVKITMSVTSGTFSLAQTTGLTFTTGDGTSDASMIFTGTVANVNAALATVNYLGNANYSGADTLNISVDDQGNTGSGGAKTDSKSIAITVAAVNDAPVLTVPGAQSVTEDTTKAITGISVVDVDAATGAVKITMSVTSGTFSLAQTTGLTFTTGDGTSDASMVFTGTVANVNAALATVNYLGNANYNGADTLNISVDDQANTGSGGAKTDSKSIAITVAAVNDAPLLTVPGAQAATEDTTKAITGISVADVDAATGAVKITMSVTSGTFSLAQTTGLTFTTGDGTSDASMVLTGTVANVNAALATVNYLGNANYNGADTLNISVDDQGNTGSGGAKTDSKSIAITVAAVNDAPVLTVPGAQSVTEDTTKAITGISVADVDAATGAVKITMSVASGTLTLAQTTGLTFTMGDGASDAAMTFTGTLSSVNAALARVDYLASANYSGADTLNISVDDQGNTGSGGAKTDSKTIGITVAAVNDAPLLTVPGAKTVNEDTLLSITGINVTDVDAATGAVKITMSVAQGQMTLAQTTGLTFTVGDGASDAAMTFTGTLSSVNAALATVNYLGNANYSGADTLNISVDDQGNTGSGGAKTASKSIAITVENADPLVGLAAWWNFNEGSGTRAADTAPPGIDDSGTLRDNASWNAFGMNGSLSFDGSGDWVETPVSTDINNRVTGARTVSGWFYVADKTISSRQQVIYEEGGDQRGLTIYIHGGRLYVGGWNIPTTESGWGGTFLSTDQIQSGHWHHVALVLSGGTTVANGALRGYLDGVEFANGAGSQLWPHLDPTGIGQAAAMTRFHTGLSANGGQGFAGMLDDLRVYNRTLSAADVARLAGAQLAEPRQLTVTIAPDSVWENGAPITGSVTRSGDLAGSLIVTLGSSDASRLAVPATLTIAAGQASGAFQLTPQNNTFADGTARITVSASAPLCQGGQDVLDVWDDEPTQQSLVAYWAMDEAGGTIVTDTAPQGVNDSGTLGGNTARVPLGLNRALKFDGDGDFVAIPDSTDVNTVSVTQRTVSLWFLVDDAAISSRKQVLFEEGGTDRGLNIYVDNGQLYVGGWNVPTTESRWTGTYLSTNQIHSGQWHNVVLVLQGGTTVQSNGLRAYLDGALFGSGVASQLWAHGDNTGIGQVAEYTRFHTGMASRDANSFAGLIDEVRIYNRALSDAEIQVLAGQQLVNADRLTLEIAAAAIPEQGGSTQATLTRSGSTSGALVVTLGGSDPSEAAVPATVTIAAGQASATFTILSVDDAVRDGTQDVTITASATGLIAGSGLLQVTDDERVLINGVVTNVTNGWTTVTLPQSYVSMVVVATPSYTRSSMPLVPRIRNATGNSFELRVDRTDGLTGGVPGVTVHYVVAEEGVYALAKDGVRMEAVKYVSTVTDSAGNFLGESRGYAQSYLQPVVLGQVQSYNDPEYSVFWSRGALVSDPASSTVLRVGKHVGEDPNKTRAAETVGYLVVEAGLGVADGVAFTAGVGAKTVQGMDNAPPYQYTLSGLSAASVAVASVAGALGADGGWAVLYGSDAVTAARLNLAVDEDSKLDAERAHTTENVGYLVFQDTALRLNGVPAVAVSRPNAAELTLDAVERLVRQAIALWDADDEGLSLDWASHALMFQIRDLPGDQLAQAASDELVLDIDAAGWGWFVDSTPDDDEEFSRTGAGELVALDGGAAVGQVDLLTVLAHELGHLRGLGHVHDDPRAVMSDSLPAGVRRVPPPAASYQAAVDRLFERNECEMTKP